MHKQFTNADCITAILFGFIFPVEVVFY
jgi:hypothetical protein